MGTAWWGQRIYYLSHDKSVVILAYLEPSEFSSHKASAFRCSALSSSALRSSARDMARPRRAGRHSGPEPGSLRPAGGEGRAEWMSKNHSEMFYFILLCLIYCVLFYYIVLCVILFYYVQFHFVLFYFIQACFILFCSVQFCSLVLCSTLFCSILL